MMMYREWYPEFKVHGPHASSQFSEYVFQYARMHETNSPCFDVGGFRHHLKHQIGQLLMAVDCDVELPNSKRSVLNTVKGVDCAKYAAPPGWHLTDVELNAAIDEGIAECAALF